ncbi:hypothetical protein HYC85_003538 [Camellia sinensis]|uniref:Uncharacterized protein n=1 Tax=Camellia sinensis TaxID=4442 RepID=A0A7J7HTZ3_CAMSI|nr:hypothetical protein HYC85_003538 [Camellia sinensis]
MEASSWFLRVLVVVILCGTVFLNNGGVVEVSHKVYMEYQSVSAVELNHLYRTGFHFQPKKH